MKIVLIVVVVLVLFVGLAGLVGAALPATRNASATREVAAPPARVWAVMTDLAVQPRWRPDLAAVEVLDATPGRERWIEHPRRGPEVRFATERRVEGEEWALTFVGPAEGRWIGRLETLPGGGGVAAGGRTRLIVEESTTVRSPWARLLARAAFDPQAFLNDYLARLAAEAERAP